MKNPGSLLAILFLGIFYPSFSQISKGSFAVGGLIGYSQNENSKTVTLTPSAYYFVLKKMGIGLIAPASYIRGNYPGIEKDNIQHFLIGPSIRYYLLPSSFRFQIMPEISFAYGLQRMERTSYSYYSSSGTYNASVTLLRLGIASTYFVSKRIGIEAMTYWEDTRSDNWGTGEFPPTNVAAGLKFYFSKNG